jgi:hypothetical protein
MGPYSYDELCAIEKYLQFLMDPVNCVGSENADIFKMTYRVSFGHTSTTSMRIRICPWALNSGQFHENVVVSLTSSIPASNTVISNSTIDPNYIYKPIVSSIIVDSGVTLSNYRSSYEISEGYSVLTDVNPSAFSMLFDACSTNLIHAGPFEMLSIYPEIGKYVSPEFFNVSAATSYRLQPNFTIVLSQNLSLGVSTRTYFLITNYYHAVRVAKPAFRNSLSTSSYMSVSNDIIELVTDLHKYRIYNLCDKQQRDIEIRRCLNELYKYGREEAKDKQGEIENPQEAKKQVDEIQE